MTFENDHRCAISKRSNKDSSALQRSEMEEIISHYQTDLLRYATVVVNNGDLAQQVVQDVFIKLFSCWDEVDRTDNRIRAWLFRVTHNTAVDLVRAEERRKVRETSYCQDLCSEQPVFKSGEVRDERLKEVLRCVRSLAESSQRVILLRLQQGMEYEEISEVTGYAVGTCRNLLSKAVRQLANLVEKTGGPHD